MNTEADSVIFLAKTDCAATTKSEGNMAIPRLKNEVWKSIDWIFDKEGKVIEGYFVSNLGRFRKGEKIRKASVTEDGYLTVNMREKRVKLHRLVAQAFIKNDDPENKTVVDHIDGIKSNCKSNNLRWVTVKENTRAAYELGLIKPKETTDVLVIDDEDNGTLYSSQTDASKATGVDLKTVNKIVRGTLKKARNMRFFKIKSFTDKRK